MPAQHGPVEARRPGLIIATGQLHRAGGGRHKCTVCTNRNNPDRDRLRAEWGCDEPTQAPQFEVDCPFCKGLDPSCEDCKGMGVIEYYRCPNTLYGPEHVDIVRGAALLEAGVLPTAGGWADQSATWVDAVGVVRGQIDEIEKRRAKRD